MSMNYPLQLRFKLLALAPQIYVEDAAGVTACYVKQKLFRLKEKVEVFTDNSRSHLMCTISADRMLDFNALYHFQTPDGLTFGSVRRRGMRSLWSAHYEVLDEAGQPAYEIREENPFVKVLDSLVGDIPVVGLFTGYFLNPRYIITKAGQTVLRMKKHRAFLESRFTIEQVSPVPAEDELKLMLSILMFALLERSRG
jgi:uncharacterized protein YxjI